MLWWRERARERAQADRELARLRVADRRKAAEIEASRARLRALRDPVLIRERLVVLYDKANRIVRYLETGDPAELDEKQQAILADGRSTFPVGYFYSLRRTIDTLESRLRTYEQRRRAA